MLGFIGTMAAFANYCKKKAAYNELNDRYEALKDAVSTYNNTKLDQYAETIQTYDIVAPDGLQFSTILRVGNLVGKLFRVQTSVVLTNTSGNTYYIGSVSAVCSVLGCPVNVYALKIFEDSERRKQTVEVNKYIAPGETMEIKLPCGISSLVDKNGNSLMDDFRKIFTEAYGVKLITSIPKQFSVISNPNKPIADAEYKIMWKAKAGEDFQVWAGKSRNIVLRYMTEAFYPTD